MYQRGELVAGIGGGGKFCRRQDSAQGEAWAYTYLTIGVDRPRECIGEPVKGDGLKDMFWG